MNGHKEGRSKAYIIEATETLQHGDETRRDEARKNKNRSAKAFRRPFEHFLSSVDLFA